MTATRIVEVGGQTFDRVVEDNGTFTRVVAVDAPDGHDQVDFALVDYVPPAHDAVDFTLGVEPTDRDPPSLSVTVDGTTAHLSWDTSPILT